MSKRRKFRQPYPAQFRCEAVELVRASGRPIKQIAHDLDVSYESLRLWVKQAEIDAGEREELRRLRREVRLLAEEREILKKAAAFRADDDPRARRARGRRSRRPRLQPRPPERALGRRYQLPAHVGGLALRCVVVDCFSRRVVGWSLQDHLRASLVLEALELAVSWRRPTRRLVHHSDRGSQYVSLAFGQRCRQAGVELSMGNSEIPSKQTRERGKVERMPCGSPPISRGGTR